MATLVKTYAFHELHRLTKEYEKVVDMYNECKVMLELPGENGECIANAIYVSFEEVVKNIMGDIRKIAEEIERKNIVYNW